MVRENLNGKRRVALFLLGCLLLNYPLVSLFAGMAEEENTHRARLLGACEAAGMRPHEVAMSEGAA